MAVRPRYINLKGKLIDLSVPRIMGIINVTPDSFFSGSRAESEGEIIEKAARMLEEGADFLARNLTEEPEKTTIVITGPCSNILNALERHPEISEKIGEKLASVISRQWETKTIMLINYSSNGDWNNAYRLAVDNFDWQRAINIWMPYTKSENPRKASFAAYNIAVGCRMIGNPKLALEWVNFAEKQFNFRELQLLKKGIVTIEY